MLVLIFIDRRRTALLHTQAKAKLLGQVCIDINWEASVMAEKPNALPSS